MTAKSPHEVSQIHSTFNEAQRSSIGNISQSALSGGRMTSMIPAETGLEDIKNELKTALRENIAHKKEIKQLRKLNRDAENKAEAKMTILEERTAREVAE